MELAQTSSRFALIICVNFRARNSISLTFNNYDILTKYIVNTFMNFVNIHSCM